LTFIDPRNLTHLERYVEALKAPDAMQGYRTSRPPLPEEASSGG